MFGDAHILCDRTVTFSNCAVLSLQDCQHPGKIQALSNVSNVGLQRRPQGKPGHPVHQQYDVRCGLWSALQESGDPSFLHPSAMEELKGEANLESKKKGLWEEA